MTAKIDTTCFHKSDLVPSEHSVGVRPVIPNTEVAQYPIVPILAIGIRRGPEQIKHLAVGIEAILLCAHSETAGDVDLQIDELPVGGLESVRHAAKPYWLLCIYAARRQKYGCGQPIPLENGESILVIVLVAVIEGYDQHRISRAAVKVLDRCS